MFQSKVYYLFFALFLCSLNYTFSQERLQPKIREQVDVIITKENFHLYLLVGQSNMAGRGIVELSDTIGTKRILRLDRNGNWDVAKEPVHFDKEGAGVGPGLSFAREMLKDNSNITIGLIPCAAGGSGIDNWLKDTYWDQTKSFPYNNALLRAKLAMQKGTLKGIIWHQGEADCSSEGLKVYEGKLIKLVEKLRSDLGIPDLAFVAGELPDFNGCHKAFNPILYKAKDVLSNFQIASASGFLALADGVHINALSQREFGKRYAEKMKMLFPDQKTKPNENIISKIIRPARIFSSNMVIQRDKPIRIWGSATDNKSFEIEFAGITKKVKPKKDGKWIAEFPAMKADGVRHRMIFSGNENFSFEDIMIGDVWICSGQSNMEWTMMRTFNSGYELAHANISEIRSFVVPNEISMSPRSDFSAGQWTVSTREKASNISAVAYFFAKEIYQSEKIPIGLICNYWGGSPAESWISQESLADYPDFSKRITELLASRNTPDFFDNLQVKSWAEQQEWLNKVKSLDLGYKEKWYQPEYKPTDWQTMLAPACWEENGLPGFDGVVWLRKDVTIPSQLLGKTLVLNMEVLNNYDVTWFNGVEIGSVSWNAGRRAYRIPPELIREGKNTITIRVENHSGNGGFAAKKESDLYIRELIESDAALSIPLSGMWYFKPALAKKDYPDKPQELVSMHTPSCVYNTKISPLTDLSVKGVIWYQGETNAYRAYQYRSLFPLLINDWRKQFNQDFPFLFVQLAGYKEITKEPVEETWAELREAQTMALALPQTGMAVAIDLGDPFDVHPINKQDVGKRLAAEAQKIVYGKSELKTSPLYKGMQIEGNKIRIRFSNAENGLMSKAAKIGGVAIADNSKKFVWANARIEDGDIVVWNDDIKNPVAVRYAWTGSPVESNGANLYNKEGFPVSPFRTDDWTPISLNNK